VEPVAVSGPPGCLEIGILLFPEHRGKGLGTAAQRLLADHLFSTTLANRLEATTEIDNVAEQRALEHAGFVREGVLRGRGFGRGKWRDGVMYSRLRDDPAPQIPID
jgi:RimJ/RimL family protein N-acetyltransferase